MGYYHRWNYIIVVIHSVDNICGIDRFHRVFKGFSGAPAADFLHGGSTRKSRYIQYSQFTPFSGRVSA